MQLHELKTQDRFFKQKLEGKKPFEFRLNDRDYKVGDLIKHREIEIKVPISHREEYGSWVETSRIVYEKVLSVTTHDDFEHIPKGWCIMGTRLLNK